MSYNRSIVKFLLLFFVIGAVVGVSLSNSANGEPNNPLPKTIVTIKSGELRSQNVFRPNFPTSTIEAVKTTKSVLIDPKRLKVLNESIKDCQIANFCPK